MNIKHHFKVLKTDVRDWENLKMVIEPDTLNADCLQSLPVYLVNHIQSVTDYPDYDQYHGVHCTVRLPGGMELTELTLWQMAFDVTDNIVDLVIDYINRLCELARNSYSEYLFYQDNKDFAGSHALHVLLDRMFDIDSPFSEKETEKILQAFFHHLKHCDLEFEFTQDEYIEKVLEKWFLINKDDAMILLCFRLFNGQATDKCFEYLHRFLEFRQRKGGLKKLIDLIITSEDPYIRDECRYEPDSYLNLCASIYGLNTKQINEVMDYVSDKVDGKLNKMSDSYYCYILRIQQECEAFREFQPECDKFIDSGFHLYDRQKKIWLPRKDDY